MENLNSVCYVAKIDEIKAIEGADNIVQGVIGGWNCIIKKGEHTAGELVVVATTDAVIPQDLSDKMGVTNYLRKGGRVRTAYVLGSGFLANYQTKVGQSSSAIDVPDRYNVLHSYNGYSGYITFSFFTPLETMTISQITMGNSSIPAASCTSARMGLYTFDGTTATLVARTAVR